MGAPLMPTPRLVLDTNTAVSALLFSSGRLSWLRGAWQRRLFVPLVSHDTATELLRVLAYPKFRLNGAEQQDLLADYLPYCETVTVPTNVVGLPDCRDPADVPFLRLAVIAKADALISGDADLLVLADTFAIAIIPPSEIPTHFPEMAVGR